MAPESLQEKALLLMRAYDNDRFRAPTERYRLSDKWDLLLWEDIDGLHARCIMIDLDGRSINVGWDVADLDDLNAQLEEGA